MLAAGRRIYHRGTETQRKGRENKYKFKKLKIWKSARVAGKSNGQTCRECGGLITTLGEEANAGLFFEAFDDAGGAASFDQIDQDDFSTCGFNDFSADHFVFAVICALNQHIRLD